MERNGRPWQLLRSYVQADRINTIEKRKRKRKEKKKEKKRKEKDKGKRKRKGEKIINKKE